MPMFAFVPWLVGLFSGFLGSTAGQAVKKVAFAGIAVSIIIGITLAFTVAIDNLISSISHALPAQAFMLGVGLLPNNTEACIGAYLTAHSLKWVYSFKNNFAQILGK